MTRIINMKASFVCAIMVALSACDSGDGNPPAGVDVSHFQGDVDWRALNEAGVDFTFIKVSEGLTNTDPEFEKNWKGAKGVGIIQGGYHVFTPTDDGELQAKHFVSRFRRAQFDYNGALPPVLDIESIPQKQLSYARPQIQKWLSYVEDQLGCRPILYTSPATWNEEDLGDFAKYGLWLADYDDRPTLPDGWTRWEFWQFSSKGRRPGIEGFVDLDRFNGTKHQLNNIACFKW